MPRRAVALLIETSNGYCRGLLEGIIAYSKHHADWSLHLTEQERGAAPPPWLKSWQGDGIIARIETDAIGRELKQLSLPIVDLSAARHLKGIPWADTHDEAISRLAFEHFVERGFRHFAFCGDPGFAWSNTRRDHFARFVKNSDGNFYDFKATPRYDTEYRWDQEKARIADWLIQLPRPVAVMGCYDFQAQKVLDVCRELSISVPEEIAVLGVDNDHLICELSEPSLSSIIPDTRGTGYEAAALLDRIMSGETHLSHQQLITLPQGIRTRQSTDTLAIEDPEIARALSFIRRNAVSNIRVQDVLKQISLSRRMLEHRFKQLIGHTPHEEITRVRIARIKTLLRETELSIHEIATRAGFEYAEYMAAAFKRAEGLSPTEYRLQSRQP